MNNNKEYHNTEEEINNMKELGLVLMEIRGRLIRKGVDIEKLLNEFRKHKKN